MATSSSFPLAFIGGGIKCDNPECDYVDQTVKVEEYKDWLNKPCPNCGCNLLTEADFENVCTLHSAVDYFNNHFFSSSSGEGDSTVCFSMDGSGKVNAEVNE